MCISFLEVTSLGAIPILRCGCSCRRPPSSPVHLYSTTCHVELNKAITWISVFYWMLDDGSLDVLIFIFHGKKMNFVSFPPLLKFTIEEFRSLGRLQLFRKGVLDRYESIQERCIHLVFEGHYPSLLGKHIDICQGKFDFSVVPTQSGHIYPICLPLLIRTTYDGLSSWKLVTERPVQGVNILGCQPCISLFRLHFRGLCQRSNTSKTSDVFDIITGQG